MRIRRGPGLRSGLVIALSLLAVTQGSALGSGADDGRIRVSQVSKSLAWASGEGWVVANPVHPQRVTAVWTSLPWGSPARAVLSPPGPHPIHCGLGYSTDGGKTWVAGSLPYQRVGLPTNLGGCADPALVVDSKGTLYSLFNGGSVIPGVGTTSPEAPSFCCSFTVSHDGGRSWSEPKLIETTEEAAQHTITSGSLDIAFDRPWLIIDPVTGTLYGSSSDDSLVQRVVFASHDHGATWSTPQPLDPDFQSVWGDVPSAAFGVLGAAYSVDPTSGFYKASPDPAVKCQQACAVFETSTNDGKTWTRHVIPADQVASGIGSQLPTAAGLQVAADPSAKGHFAVLVPVTASTDQVWLTTDKGRTWKRTGMITASGSGTIAKTWVAYGAAGAAAVVWRNLHSDGSYDVLASVSTTGGLTFGAPVKLTRTPAPAPRQPAGRPGDDCACNLYLDGKYLYTTWGDSRSGNLQVWLARYRY